MVFAKLHILIIEEDLANIKQTCKCLEPILNEITEFGYTIQQTILTEYSKESIQKELVEKLKECDVVVIIGPLGKSKFITYSALAEMCRQDLLKNEKMKDILTDIKPKFIDGEIILPKYTKILMNKKHYPIIYFNRIFVLLEKAEELVSSMNNVVKLRLQIYSKKPTYTKVFKVLKNDKIKKLKYNLSNGMNVVLEENANDFDIVVSADTVKKLNSYEKTFSQQFGLDMISKLYRDLNATNILVDKDTNIQFAVNCILTCLKTNTPENVFISFNGGKDCTVLLHLMLIILAENYPSYKKPIYCMYVQDDHPFQELNKFIDEIREYYNLEIVIFKGGIKEALAEILLRKPNLKACLMGTRRTDPFSANLQAFQMTDKDWPSVMRVSPLLDWDYSHIWDYLLYYKVPYCSLYDHGYTSLGNVNNTDPNPELSYKAEYLPAYKLFIPSRERSGRKSVKSV